jgi:hypothetical protein
VSTTASDNGHFRGNARQAAPRRLDRLKQAEAEGRAQRNMKLAYPTFCTLAFRGVRGVHLRTVRVGACPATTRQWLFDFFAAVDKARRLGKGPTAPLPRSTGQRRRSSERAGRELVKRGF